MDSLNLSFDKKNNIISLIKNNLIMTLKLLTQNKKRKEKGNVFLKIQLSDTIDRSWSDKTEIN